MSRVHVRAWSMAAGLLTTAALTTDCRRDEPGTPCSPCLTLREGSVSAAGDPRIDGYLVAAHQLETGVGRQIARFDAAMIRLATTHGLPAGDVTPQFVDDVARLVTSDILEHVDGELRSTIEPSTCTASRSTALDALQRCERAADCQPRTLELPFPATCVGRCRGLCDGDCTGALSCVTSLPAPCPGPCDGVCVPSEPLPCEGLCRGTCEGDCDLVDAEGLCQGNCDGPCDGSCRPERPSPCIGTCHGRCAHEPDDPGCTGAIECEGDLTPPPTDLECAASRACQLQARAQGIASLTCDSAAVRFGYDLDPLLEVDAIAAFEARMEVLAAVSRTVLETKAYLDLMLAGLEPQGAPLLDPPPLQRVRALLSQSVVEAEAGGLEIASGQLDCIEPALAEASDRLGDQPDDAQRVRDGQTRFIELLP